LLYSR